MKLLFEEWGWTADIVQSDYGAPVKCGQNIPRLGAAPTVRCRPLSHRNYREAGRRPEPAADLAGPRRGVRLRRELRVGEPLTQLLLQIRAIEKASLLEERALHPADEILDTAFLLRPVRPAHLHPEPQVERHARKRRMPFRHDAIAAPLQRHGLRPIKDRDQRDAAKRGDVIHKRAHRALDLLIGDQRHFCPARVFQSRREEVDDLFGPVLIAHTDFTEVVLRKLPRKAFEADQRRDDTGPERLREGIDRALATPVPPRAARDGAIPSFHGWLP